MTTAIDAAKTLSAKNQAAAEAAYQKMIRFLATGGELPPEEIISITEATGRNLDQLVIDQSQLEERIAWAATIAKAAEAEIRRAEIDRLIAAEVEAFAKVQAAHVAKVRDLQSQLPKTTLAWDAGTARAQLLKTAPAHLAEREKQLAAERADLLRQAERCTDVLKTAPRGPRRNEEFASSQYAKSRTPANLSQLNAAREAVARTHAQLIVPNEALLAELNERLSGIDLEVNEIHAAKLKP